MAGDTVNWTPLCQPVHRFGILLGEERGGRSTLLFGGLASLCPPWSCLLPLAIRELKPRGFTCRERPQHKAGRKSAEEGGKINILQKKRGAGAARIGSGVPVGVKPSVPGGRAPRLCPRAAAHRERGADQPTRVSARFTQAERAESRRNSASLLTSRQSGSVVCK